MSQDPTQTPEPDSTNENQPNLVPNEAESRESEAEHLDSSPSELLQMLAASRNYSGPIPPPEMLREYNEIDPGRAAKILQLAEDQTRHRMELEKAVVGSDIKRSWGGLIAGFLIACGTVGAGTYVAVAKSPTAGATIATTAVVALTSVFVYGTSSQRKERKEKAKSLGEAQDE